MLRRPRRGNAAASYAERDSTLHRRGDDTSGCDVMEISADFKGIYDDFVEICDDFKGFYDDL